LDARPIFTGETGMDGISVSGEVVTAGTALAGLILIYIGSLATAFEARQPGGERNSVRLAFLGKAWIAFVGLFLALLAAGLSIFGKWTTAACPANVAVWVLFAAFGWAVFATIQIIRGIK
jgi:hypothetical protein